METFPVDQTDVNGFLPQPKAQIFAQCVSTAISELVWQTKPLTGKTAECGSIAAKKC